MASCPSCGVAVPAGLDWCYRCDTDCAAVVGGAKEQPNAVASWLTRAGPSSRAGASSWRSRLALPRPVAPPSGSPLPPEGRESPAAVPARRRRPPGSPAAKEVPEPAHPPAGVPELPPRAAPGPTPHPDDPVAAATAAPAAPAAPTPPGDGLLVTVRRPPPRGPSRPVVAVLGTLAMAVAGLVVSRAGDGPGGAAAPASTTSRPAPSSASPVATTQRPPVTTAPPPYLDEPSGGIVLGALESDGDLASLDLDTSATVYERDVVANTNNPFGPDPGAFLLRRRDRMVLVADGHASSWPLRLDGSRRREELGPALAAVPSLAEDRVWLVGLEEDGPAVREQGVDDPATPGVALPPDRLPVAAVEGGLVLEGGEQVEVWDPATGRVGRRLPRGAVVVAAAGRTIAWRVEGCTAGRLCALHATDAVTGADRLHYVGPVGGAFAYRGSGAAFSPDGRTLAVTVQDVVPDDPRGVRPLLVLLDVETGASQHITSDRLLGVQGVVSVAWSSSGQWVFLAPFPNEASSVLLAHRLGTEAFFAVRRPSAARAVVALVAS